MKFDDFYRILSENKYYVFSCQDIAAFFPAVNKTALIQSLFRWKKNGLIEALRKGLYELVYPVRRELPDMHLANKIYSPSCVSLETALSHYSIIPEVAMAVTSITSKTTRRFKNSHGLFVYRSVQPKAFCGYTIENHGGSEVMIAEPEKALVDLFHFKTLRGAEFDSRALRFDSKKILRLNRAKMDKYGRLYGLHAKGILDACL